MITDKILPKLRFTIRQAVNPNIQQSENKFIDKAEILPVAINKKTVNYVRKILNRDVNLHSQPNTDMLVLSTSTTKAAKVTKTDNHNRGKNIRNVLENYFDNKSAETIDAELTKTNEIDKVAKEENLKQLVQSYEKENLFSSSRKQALKIMAKEGREKLEWLKEGNKSMLIDIKNNNYCPNSADISLINIIK